MIRFSTRGLSYRPDFFILAIVFLIALTCFLYIHDEAEKYSIICIGVVSIILMLCLRYHVKRSLREINDWSNADNLIPCKKLYRSAIIDKNHLKQLLRFRRQVRKFRINQKKWTQYNLKEAAERERELFLREMRRVLSVPLISLKTSIYLMKDDACKPVSIQRYQEVLNLMADAVIQIETLTAREVFLQPVSPTLLLHKAVTMQQKMAIEQGVNLNIEIKENLPLLLLDPIRFQQILVGTLYHSISFVPSGKNVCVSSKTIVENKKSFLEVIIKDNGLGLNISERKNLRALTQKHYGEKFLMPDLMVLEICVIEHLLGLHNGSFSMHSSYLQGTSFVIKIPYQSHV
jgi:signal transduction histidine kinase